MKKPFRLVPVIFLAACLLLIVGCIGLRSVAIFFLKREAEHALRPATSVIAEKLGDRSIPVKCCLLGDSRAAEWGSFPVEEVLNLGLPGATTAEIHGAVSSVEARLLGEVVVIQCGINDLKTLGYNGRPPETFAALVASKVMALANVQLKLGADKVLVTGVFPTGAIPLQRRAIWNSKIEQARLLVNAALQSAAREHGYHYIDTDAALADKTLFRDVLHLNEKGYQSLNRLLAEHLAAGS